MAVEGTHWAVASITFGSWLEGGYQWPQLAERVHKVREVGMVLSQSFGGQASQLVAQANHSAVELVRLITAHFPGFRDEVIYHGRQVRTSRHHDRHQ